MRAEEGLIVLDQSGHILWANAGAAALLECPAPELRSRSLASVGPIASALSELCGSPTEELDGEAQFSGRQGRRLLVQWKLCRLVESGGQAQFLLHLAP